MITNFKLAETLFLEKGGWCESKVDERYTNPQLVRTFYCYKCNNCQSVLESVRPGYALERMDRKYCKNCFRTNPERFPPFKEYPRRTDIPLNFQTDPSKGLADIYLRVSTKRQEQGDGLRRQEYYGIEYCQQNKIKVRNIIQDICSAYTEDNLVTGNLGYKISQWEKALEQPPKYLIIESWDRLTRQPVFTALGHLLKLKSLGVDVISYNSWEGEQCFTSALTIVHQSDKVSSL